MPITHGSTGLVPTAPRVLALRAGSPAWQGHSQASGGQGGASLWLILSDLSLSTVQEAGQLLEFQHV